MEENRTQLRRSSQRLIAVIYVLIIGIAVGLYFLINDLEQSGIVRDTQTERSWGTGLLLLIWTLVCYRLYRINTRIFDLRSQVFDARENEHFATKEAARLREQFMANMSHEIRTPLNGIIGFSSLLMRAQLPERERELASNIQVSSETLLSIVNDILDFSKIEAGMLVLEKVPFDPHGLFHSVLQMFSEKARQKNLRLDFECSPGLPKQLLGDPTRLTQILVNLIGNALKFTETGGVMLRVSLQEPQAAKLCKLRIEVQDSGIGIASDQIDRVFERFTQSDEQTTRIYGGTGLGLSIVKQLTEAMQGKISLQSELNKGSTFTVELPFERSEANTNASSNKPGSTKETSALFTEVRILVVEDNPMNRRVVELLFAEWNLRFAMAVNGREAVELLANGSTAFDLVLMDIQMPEMDGYQATQQIRHTLGLSIPIVAMTAHALAGEREKCLRLGMNDYIAKPFREQELLQIIGRFTRKPGQNERLEMDRAYLQETTLGNIQYQQELAGIFLSQAPKDLDAITSALSTAQLEEAARAAHNMKSTVGYMGFAQNIGRQLASFEQDCKDKKDLSYLLHSRDEIAASTHQAMELVRQEWKA